MVNIEREFDAKIEIPEMEDMFSFQAKEQLILNVVNEFRDIMKDDLWELLIAKKYDGPSLRFRMKYKIDDGE